MKTHTFQEFFKNKKKKFFNVVVAKPSKIRKNKILKWDEEQILTQYWLDLFVSNQEKEKHSKVAGALKNHPTTDTFLRQKFITFLFGEIVPELKTTDRLVFQTIKLIDLYLAYRKEAISPREYLLAGVTCLWLQSKVTEHENELFELKFAV